MARKVIWKSPDERLYITEHYPKECLNPQYNLYLKKLFWWDELILWTRHEDGLNQLRDVAYEYEGHI